MRAQKVGPAAVAFEVAEAPKEPTGRRHQDIVLTPSDERLDRITIFPSVEPLAPPKVVQPRASLATP